jgi:hypothetical protein
MNTKIEKYKLLFDYYDGNGKKYEFNGTVSVGNYGTIFAHQAKRGKTNVAGCFKFGRKTEQGYLQVVLTDVNGNKGWFYVHRLVATVWLKKKSFQYDVMHLDDNPTNNHISNLRWGTHLDNMRDKINKGRCNMIGKTKYSDDVLIEIYNRRQRGECKWAIKEDYPDIKHSTFSHFTSGRALRLRGLIQ